MKIHEILFEKHYEGERNFVPIADIPVEFLKSENDIMVHLEEGYNDSNGWNEGRTTLVIGVYREQNEEEKAKMKKHFEELKVESKKEEEKNI